MRIWMTRRPGLKASCVVLVGVLALLGPVTASGQAGPLVQAANNPKYGSILVNAQGMTLYILTSEAGGSIKCSGQCLNFWPPLLLPSGTTTPTAGSGVAGKLGTVTRSDGTVQVTYNGYPLYLFANDKAPGDTNGVGIQAFGGTWEFVRPNGVPLAATPVEQLFIRITATDGTVRGKVTARYVYQHRQAERVCARPSCQFNVPFGVTVHLAQTPANAAAWPFKAWQIRTVPGQATPRSTGRSAASVKMNAGYRVKAVYAAG